MGLVCLRTFHPLFMVATEFDVTDTVNHIDLAAVLLFSCCLVLMIYFKGTVEIS